MRNTFSKVTTAASIALAITFTSSCTKEDGIYEDVISPLDVSSSSVTQSSSSSSSSDVEENKQYTFTDNRDGQTYKYVIIGSQMWMAENLNYGNSSCYGDNPENCEKYGRLYEGNHPVNCINGTNCTGAILDFCPTGWRTPTSEQWQQLVDFTNGNLESLEFLLGGYFAASPVGNNEYTGIGEVGSWLTSTPWQYTCPDGVDCVAPIFSTGFYTWRMTDSGLVKELQPYSSLHSVRCIAVEQILCSQNPEIPGCVAPY